MVFLWFSSKSISSPIHFFETYINRKKSRESKGLEPGTSLLQDNHTHVCIPYIISVWTYIATNIHARQLSASYMYDLYIYIYMHDYMYNIYIYMNSILWIYLYLYNLLLILLCHIFVTLSWRQCMQKTTMGHGTLVAGTSGSTSLVGDNWNYAHVEVDKSHRKNIQENSTHISICSMHGIFAYIFWVKFWVLGTCNSEYSIRGASGIEFVRMLFYWK